jgi:hypothetical protein
MIQGRIEIMPDRTTYVSVDEVFSKPQ